MPLSLTTGSVPIAGYQLIGQLGRGGFGEVWEAEAPGGVRVALKFIRVGTAQARPELRALEIIRNIRHPHLLDVQFWVQADDYVVIAMPLCDQSLLDRLRECQRDDRAGIPRDELLGYMDELARAIDFLNEPRHLNVDGTRVGIQHRDIKPHNVFLVGGSVRLADFGLAKFLQENAGSHTGSMSPHYVAPETLRGTVTTRTDQYSLAVTYYHLCTGRLPFAGETIGEVIHAHLQQTPDLSRLPEHDRAAVRRALAKEPDDRWPNCQAFVRALRCRGDDLADTEPETWVDGVGSRPGASQAPESSGTLPFLGSDRGIETTTRPLSGSGDSMGPRPQPTGPGVNTTTLPFSDVPAPISTAPVEMELVSSHPAGKAGAGAESRVEAEAEHGGRQPGRRRPLLVGAFGLGLIALAAVVIAMAVGRGADLAPIRLRFEPPTSTVIIDGQPRTPDPLGWVELPDPKGQPISIAAHAEGFRDFSAAMSRDALEKSGFKIVLPREELSEEQLEHQARQILKKYCYSCHGIDFRPPGLDVLDRDSLVADREGDAPPYLVPGKAEQSPVWRRVGVEGDMPPEGSPRPSAREVAILKRWIDAGARFTPSEPRPLRSVKDTLTAIRDHLRGLPEGDRPSYRYLTLTNQHNDGRRVDAEALRLARAAVAKLLNSLSRQPKIVVPEVIDDAGTVLGIDLRGLAWTEDGLWRTILEAYPYGLNYAGHRDQALAELAREVADLSGEELPYVRADWFVATASRPPLYHALLGLPETAEALAEQLRVDVRGDFLHDRLSRAGISRSGETTGARILDRHSGPGDGAYWVSYDFGARQGAAGLDRAALSPPFAGHPAPDLAAGPDGGAILFSLPNGLLGSMIVDGQGRRVDARPPELALDPLETSGSPALVNGLSCLGCHRLGPIPVRGELRRHPKTSPEAGAKLAALVPEQAALDKLVSDDEARFLDACRKAMNPLLGDADAAAVPEPIGALARRYQKDLGPEDIARELGGEDPSLIRAKVANTPRLRKLGLEPIVHGRTVTRQVWNRTFGQIALELDLGHPHSSS